MDKRSANGRYLATFEKDEVIFREGDRGAEMFIVHAGRVEIVAGAERPGRRIAVLEKGDFFGEMSLLEDMPRNASARALNDVLLVRVDRATFDRMLREDPEIAVRIMRKLSRRLRETDRALRDRTTPRPTDTGAHPVGPGDEARLESSESGAEVAPDTSDGADGGVDEAGGGASARPAYWLVHAGSQARFGLDTGVPHIVGRRDPVTGISPSIDLTAVDPERSSSRQHASLRYRGGRWLLVEDIGTTNGTFVNGDRLESGIEVEVSVGDRLRFGLADLELHGG